MLRKLVLSLCLVATACGGGGDSGGLDGDRQAIADAIYDQLTADTTPDNPFGETEARCFSDRVATDFTPAEMADLGLSASDIAAGTEPADVELSDDQANRMTDAMVDCVDFRALLIDEFVAGGVSEDSASCLADGFDDDLLKTIAKAELTNAATNPLEDPALGERMFGLIADCLSVEDLSNLGG